GGRGSIRGSPRDWGNTHVWLSRVQLDIETLNWQRPFKHPSRSHVASKATARPARDVHQSLTCRLRADLGELHGPPLTPAPTLSTLSLLLTTMVPTGRRTPRSFQSRARTCDKKVATGLTQQKGGAAALVPNAETDSDSDKRKGMRRRRRRRRKEEGGGGCTQISLRCRTMATDCEILAYPSNSFVTLVRPPERRHCVATKTKHVQRTAGSSSLHRRVVEQQRRRSGRGRHRRRTLRGWRRLRGRLWRLRRRLRRCSGRRWRLCLR
ncbi:unnamed protein product, partial [Prorocentrum cordatum]